MSTVRDLLRKLGTLRGIQPEAMDGLLDGNPNADSEFSPTPRQMEKMTEIVSEYLKVRSPGGFYKIPKGATRGTIKPEGTVWNGDEASWHAVKVCVREIDRFKFTIGCPVCIERMESDKEYMPCWRKAAAVEAVLVK